MLEVCPGQESDKSWIEEALIREWDGPMIERAGEFIDARTLPAIVAWIGGRRVGLATLLHLPGATEIMTINSFEKGMSIGTEMLAWIERDAMDRGSTKIVVFTSNDNIDALRFYQRRGFRLEKIWRDSITEARKVKTTIPLKGHYGIPCCDEIELTKDLPIRV
ncbi:MAG: GNAT family N-acetyltransferase [Armatimonadetes bacterium]|nr:GNAT family N-acetyltransferase [Armatimonadota bacterium]